MPYDPPGLDNSFIDIPLYAPLGLLRAAGFLGEEIASEGATIADDAFVHITTPNCAPNILSKGLDPEISGYVTKWKYIKDVTDPGEFNTMMYRQDLWNEPEIVGRFDNGASILKIDRMPSFYSPRTNWVNGVPQWRFNDFVNPEYITLIKKY